MSAVRKIEDLTKDPELAGQYDIEEARTREKFECHLTGYEEGIEQRNIEIAKSKLKKEMDIDTISEITGLSIEEIMK